jgi:hypothetical protein
MVSAGHRWPLAGLDAFWLPHPPPNVSCGSGGPPMLTVTILNDNTIRIQTWINNEPQVWVIYTPDQVDDLIAKLELARDLARSTDETEY